MHPRQNHTARWRTDAQATEPNYTAENREIHVQREADLLADGNRATSIMQGTHPSPTPRPERTVINGITHGTNALQSP